MPVCPCCSRDDPVCGTANSAYRPRTKCAYCAGYPHSETGQCWGHHGAQLERYLTQLVKAGKMTPATMARWLMVDIRQLETQPGTEITEYLDIPLKVKLPKRYR